MLVIIISSAVLLTICFMFQYMLAYQDFQICGVLFSPQHAQRKDTQNLLKKYKTWLSLGIFFFLTFQLLFLLPALRRFLDISLLLVILGYLVYGFILSEKARRALLRFKEERGWVYEEENKRLTDTDVSKERGKSAPKALWIWLIWLTYFLPEVIFWAAGEREPLAFIIFAIAPLTLIVMPLSYKKSIVSRRPAVSEDRLLNKAYARALERETGLNLIRIFAVTSLWWNGLALALGFLEAPYSLWVFVIALIVFVFVLIGLLFYGMKKREAINRRYYAKISWQIPQEDKHYRWGFYYNKEDARLMVPKQVESMGYTLNMAKPAAKIIMAVTLLFIVGVLSFAVTIGVSPFRFALADGAFEVKVPFYGIKLEPEEVTAVELVEKPLENAVRIHGLAATERRYGAYRLKPYGRIDLYVYNRVKEHIVLELKEGEEVKAVVINEDTAEKTRLLYEQLLKWQAGAQVPASSGEGVKPRGR